MAFLGEAELSPITAIIKYHLIRDAI